VRRLEVPAETPKLNPMESPWMVHKKRVNKGIPQARTFAEREIIVWKKWE
jgi:transposase